MKLGASHLMSLSLSFGSCTEVPPSNSCWDPGKGAKCGAWIAGCRSPGEKGFPHGLGLHPLHLTVPTSVFQTGPSITVTCTEGKWNKQVACEPVDCGIPDQHHVHAASFSCLEGTTFGSKCSFHCRHPAQLKGTRPRTASRLRGLNTGAWTGGCLCFWSLPPVLCRLPCCAAGERVECGQAWCLCCCCC